MKKTAAVCHLVLLLQLSASAADVAKAEFVSFFAHSPTNSLAAKLLPQPVAPIGVTQQYQWDSTLHGVIVTSEANAGGDAAILDLAFRIGTPNDGAAGSRLVYRNEQWYGSAFWSGPDWTRVGKDWHHPGQSTPSVRCFIAPRDGRATVSGRVFKLHLDGDGVRASIRLGEREVWKADIAGKDDKGVEPNLTLDLHKGDSLRFIVDKRGGIACDTTHWDPIVAYAGGMSFQASKSFSTKQGEGGWFYELQGRWEPERTVPTISILGRDLAMRELPAGPHAGELPFAVIEDGLRKSSVALALDTEGDWSIESRLGNDGIFHVTLRTASRQQSVPKVTVVPVDGPWTAGLPLLSRLKMPMLEKQVANAYRAATARLERAPELELLVLAQKEWRRDDKIAETTASYGAAIKDHLDRAHRLVIDLKHGQPGDFLAKEQRDLQTVAALVEQKRSVPELRELYLQTRLLKRGIALRNPLLNFDRLLFCKRMSPGYSHLVGQYFGWRQRAGGDLCILDRPGYSLTTRDLVGKQLPAGSYLEPCLSFDGQRIAFSYVAPPAQSPSASALPVNEQGAEEAYYHIYEINADGSGLRQLTSGCYDDMMPCYLPDGGVAFVSTRRRSYSRCFGSAFSNRWHSYTLHRMNADGSGMRILSVNDVSEWFPSVAEDGQILFARWDYIDRDAVTHQNLWAAHPDGTNPTAVWGNATPKPHCTFQAKSIPGSHKIVFIASAHHAVTGGPVCVLDPTVDPNSLDAIVRVTPGPFPEAESSRIDEYYASPWPLSEKYFLVSYSPERLRFEGEQIRGNVNPDNALGLYLLDAAGNRELIYRDPQIGCTSPIPLMSRSVPPVVPSKLAADAPATGEMLVTDIYAGLGNVPRGTIKQLRIVQIFPKTTWIANSPRIGIAGEENARAILGTVPVEADGSARFVVPAHKPILFQALDKDGFACQTMRATTYVQPGERISCVGCHEHRMSAPGDSRDLPMAMRKPASRIKAGDLGGRPFSFVEVVQPVLDKHCVRCHSGDKPAKGIVLTGQPLNGFSQSYWSLCGNPDAKLVPRYAQRNQVQMTPVGGSIGALGSRLMQMLRDGHSGVKLGDSEIRRLAAWIDCNAVFYGAYDPAEQSRQLAGQTLGMPEIQ